MERRLTLPPGRCRLLSLAAIAAAVVTTSACGGGSPAAAKDPPLAQYKSRYLSFSYPAAWTAYAPTGPGELHFHPAVYLSTQPVHHACSMHGNETTCDWPVRNLRPGGVLAVWELPYPPPVSAFGFKPQGRRTTVGGLKAWRADQNGGDCGRIGADRTIDVLIPPSNELIVCLRGPGLAQDEKSVHALLASTKFHAS
jgi:hypothetical protein